jgi:hypothetical protein
MSQRQHSLIRHVTVKAYKTYQEVHGGAGSNTKRNEQLEANIRAAQSLRASLRPPHTLQATPDPVYDITAKCNSRADELLALLEYVRGSGRKIGSVRASLRAIKKSKDIEKLQRLLRKDQNTLNQMILEKVL